MKKEKKAFENIEVLDITEEDIDRELENIKNELNLYNIEYPPQSEIDKCIENSSIYMEKKKSMRQLLKDVLRRAEIELGYINKFYWIINIIIFFIAFKVAVSTDFNPYGIVVLVSPIPFILGIMEVLKGRENNMLELELSFKISGKEEIFTRIIIMSIFNIILNTSICSMLSKMDLNIKLLRINLFWIVPFIWINLIALFIAKKIRSYTVSLSIISVWMILSSMVFSNKHFSEKIISLNIAAYIIVALIGTCLVYVLLKSYFKMDMDGFICENGGINV